MSRSFRLWGAALLDRWGTYTTRANKPCAYIKLIYIDIFLNIAGSVQSLINLNVIHFQQHSNW
jgi:hypothetical protein